MASNSNDQGSELVPRDASDETAITENSAGDESQQPPPEPAQTSYFGIAKGLMVRAVIIYFISSFFHKPSPTPAGENNSVQPSGGAGVAPKGSVNVYSNGTVMDMYLYLSEDELSVDFDDKNLVWHIPDIVYGDWYGGPDGNSIYTLDTTIDIPERVQNNGSLWGHIFFVRTGKSPNPLDKGRYSYTQTVHKYKRLNRFKKRHFTKTHNLLTGETTASAEDVAKLLDNLKMVEISSHWHPNMTVNIVDDHTPWTRGHVPPPLDAYIEFEPTTGKYFPIVYFNDYWNLLRDYTPINSTTKTLPLMLTFQPLSLFRWQLYTAQAMRSQFTSFLGQDLMQESDDEHDSLKEALLETSPYLLGLTFVISIVHSVFEFLAFKNDIQFWKNRKSLEGLSVRSVCFNVIQSFIVLLYILDNDTNLMVRISVFVGLIIEFWKIHKVVNIKLDRENKIFGIIPRLSFSEKSSYIDSPTKEYDMLAFRYLSWVLYPLLVVYAIYSVIYHEHKGWYSFVLSMLYGFLLTFGFIMMTPQLFINYKLKSVAHLPWRMLTYKSLNTFIDDIFAFVIKMPTMYRLGCFRDDIIFLIFLYQRWIYRVDLKRVNEFGVSGEKEDEVASPENTQGEQTTPITNGVSKQPAEKKND